MPFPTGEEDDDDDDEATEFDNYSENAKPVNSVDTMVLSSRKMALLPTQGGGMMQ